MITLRDRGDYLQFVCGEQGCGSPLEVTYLGLDPAIPRLHFRCTGCGGTDVFKIAEARKFPYAPSGTNEPIDPHDLD